MHSENGALELTGIRLWSLYAGTRAPNPLAFAFRLGLGLSEAPKPQPRSHSNFLHKYEVHESALEMARRVQVRNMDDG